MSDEYQKPSAKMALLMIGGFIVLAIVMTVIDSFLN